MAQTKSKSSKSSARATAKAAPATEVDGVYILKLVLYVVLGSLWLKLGSDSSLDTTFPLPLGLAVGLIFASHEHFRIDRKIEYAVLIVAALIGLMAPYGLFMTV
jgi:hypothetical protein